MNKPNKLPSKNAQIVGHFSAKSINSARPSDPTTITVTSLTSTHVVGN